MNVLGMQTSPIFTSTCTATQLRGYVRPKHTIFEKIFKDAVEDRGLILSVDSPTMAYHSVLAVRSLTSV